MNWKKLLFWKNSDVKDQKQVNEKKIDHNTTKAENDGPSLSPAMRLTIRGAPPPYVAAAPGTPPSPAGNDVDTPMTDSLERLTLHPSASPEPGLLVKLTPPSRPDVDVVVGDGHVGCDIVLVIDVSGSMGDAAPVPGDNTEDYGLTVLDLVQHAARTIVATLDEGDRLGLVQFHSTSTIVQNLTPMTNENKETTNERINTMVPRMSTNLWHGIRDGLKLFEEQEESGRVPAIMVLTDGVPNIMCPAQGYVPKMRTMLPFAAPIHTFGFGYSLRSGLLKSIAEVSGGNYAFIPDAGMIGTVFVHAVANLQSTFAKSAILTLTYPARLALASTTGESVEQEEPTSAAASDNGSTLPGGHLKLVVKLGNVQYGQSRDIWFKAVGATGSTHDQIKVDVEYSLAGYARPQYRALSGTTTLAHPTNLDSSELIYHRGRSALVSFLSSLFPTNELSEHVAVASEDIQKKTASQVESLVALLTDSEKFVQSIRRDLVLDNGTPGQVTMALESSANFRKWGMHFLPSLANAHLRQICNSFKDPGPLAYGTNSPLFIACRDRLDKAFDNVAPPEPSIRERNIPQPSSKRASRFRQHAKSSSGTSVSSQPFEFSSHRIDMSLYNSSYGACFAGATLVRLASGASKPIRALRRHDNVETPLGSRQVVAILRTRVQQSVMTRIGDFLISPWHPVSTNAKSWEFPARVPDRGQARYTGCIYSILLEPDSDPTAHAIKVGSSGNNDYWGVTLGHGVVGGLGTPENLRNDVRAHHFLGSYIKVVRALQRLDCGVGGVVNSGGVRRDPVSRKVVGFKRVKVDRPGLAEAAVELALMVDGKYVPSQALGIARRVRPRRGERRMNGGQGGETPGNRGRTMDRAQRPSGRDLSSVSDASGISDGSETRDNA